MKVRRLLCAFALLLLSACGVVQKQTPLGHETTFKGNGHNWEAEYVYNPRLYQKKRVDWVYLTYKGQQQPSLGDINITLKSRDGTLLGNLDAMDSQAAGNRIKFLVGTVNFETYLNDTYKLTVNCNGTHETLTLKSSN